MVLNQDDNDLWTGELHRSAIATVPLSKDTHLTPQLLQRDHRCIYCAVESDKTLLMAFMRQTVRLLFNLLICCVFVLHTLSFSFILFPVGYSTSLPLFLFSGVKASPFHQGPGQLFENLIRCDRHIYFSARITVALRSRLHATLHRWAVTYTKQTARKASS